MNGGVYNIFTGEALWSNSPAGSSNGPMNREAVWIDSDCDGNVNPLAADAKTTIAAIYNNLGEDRTIFMGVGADNQFNIVVNGVSVIDTLTTDSDMQFKMWHVIPIKIKTGINYFNLIAIGDGSADDSVAMVLYDNTAAQLLSSTSNSQLNILFQSSQLVGTTFDIATCPINYTMDTSGGSGSYTCIRRETKICNSIS